MKQDIRYLQLDLHFQAKQECIAPAGSRLITQEQKVCKKTYSTSLRCPSLGASVGVLKIVHGMKAIQVFTLLILEEHVESATPREAQTLLWKKRKKKETYSVVPPSDWHQSTSTWKWTRIWQDCHSCFLPLSLLTPQPISCSVYSIFLFPRYFPFQRVTNIFYLN